MRHLKEEFDRLSMREMISYALAVGCMVAAVVAVFLSLWMEPEGAVHESVLTYFGLSSAFAGSILGISLHYRSKLEDFKREAMGAIEARLEGASGASGLRAEHGVGSGSWPEGRSRDQGAEGG